MFSIERLTMWSITLALGAASAASAGTPLGHVEQRGAGPTPVVLISGLACDWTVWEDFMDRNTERFTMYAVTLPGMAGTDAPPKPEAEGGTPWLDATALVTPGPRSFPKRSRRERRSTRTNRGA